MPKKVIVAMSGGVDSSVSAALLQKQGFDVTGVFMRLWGVHSRESEKRARRVAKILKIPFRIINLEKEFKKRVVDSFLKEYRSGRTPNPCVVCNKEIKFGLLMERALALGAEYLATGHYVRRQGERTLRGIDPEKDQSYFLWRLSQKQLKHVLFPVGGYTKSEVRNLARNFKLPVAETPESQEICFVVNTINEFLRKHFKPKKGKIVDANGKVLGEHQGLIYYTIGQRKGIGLGGGPYFVLAKNQEKNLLIITKNGKTLLQKEVVFKNANWVSGKKPKLGETLKAKIRSRHQGAVGTLREADRFVFDKPQRAITPGQSVVFYKGQELLGGGIIS